MLSAEVGASTCDLGGSEDSSPLSGILADGVVAILNWRPANRQYVNPDDEKERRITSVHRGGVYQRKEEEVDLSKRKLKIHIVSVSVKSSRTRNLKRAATFSSEQITTLRIECC